HVHDVDFVYYLFGKPQGVYSRGYSKTTGEIDHVQTQYLYDSGALVSAEGSWCMADGWPFSMRYSVNFERASAEFDSSRADTLIVYGDNKSEVITTDKHDGYAGEMSYFIECVKTGQKPHRVTADDAVAGLQIIEAERKSIETGLAVAV
ncbi:MAG: afr 7, partial [Phycisphaerales bacterium]|nr:afr 7 [Phycisphaerales bacterium]